MKLQLLFLIITFSLLSYSAKAQLNDYSRSNIGIQTAGSSLLIPSGARSSGMAATGIACSNPQEAIFWNPAIIPFSDKAGGFTMQLMPWYTALGLTGVYHYAFGGFYRINAGRDHPIFLGLAVRNITLRSLYPWTLIGTHVPKFELAVMASASTKISDYVSVATAIRYMDSRFSIQNASGPMKILMADLSINLRKEYLFLGKELEFSGALVLANLGPKVSYGPFVADEFLPANLALGYSLLLNLFPNHRIAFTQEARKLLVPGEGLRSDFSSLRGMVSSIGDSPEGFRGELKEISTGIGVEFLYKNWLSLRSGYTWVHPEQGERRIFTVGAGVTLKDMSIDASFWIPTKINNPFQNTWSVGIGWRV